VTTVEAPDAGSPRDPPCDVVAAFDFDGTVTRGGSVVPFLVSVRGRAAVAAAVAPLAPALVRAAVAGGTAADRSKEALFERLLGGLPESEVAERGRVFVREHLEARLRAEVAGRLAWHRDLGHRVVIVSASPELYVEVAGDLLGAEAVLATRLAVDDHGQLTGRYAGRNCRGEEKLRRLEAWIRDHTSSTGGSRPHLWAYGNSRGDLRMLRAADHGVDAGFLGPVGRLRRFPSLGSVIRVIPEQPGTSRPEPDRAPGREATRAG
jgi:phosphatidylglycerophosphatase C